VHVGLDSPTAHNRTEDAVKVMSGSIVVSFANTFIVCTTFSKLAEVSATATGSGGAVTLGVMVALTYWPRSSTAW
jgi:hypothetical protein